MADRVFRDFRSVAEACYADFFRVNQAARCEQINGLRYAFRRGFPIEQPVREIARSPAMQAADVKTKHGKAIGCVNLNGVFISGGPKKKIISASVHRDNKWVPRPRRISQRF